jgi:hypothetical protein
MKGLRYDIKITGEIVPIKQSYIDLRNVLNKLIDDFPRRCGDGSVVDNDNSYHVTCESTRDELDCLLELVEKAN